MITFSLKSITRLFSLSWLTGPIFDKELRVSSRRRRNYVLRFAYIGLLTVFVVLVWHSMVNIFGGAAYQISQMSEAGKAIIATITIFQFIATQLLAVIMLSTSISDEIYNRTLGVLMTTPINSFQIVMGKLFSKLLQLILLLAISLPLLAIVRVFGGVPWDYIISSLAITFTAVLFAGSLSLYFSVKSKRAYAVMLKTIFTLAAVYIFIPAMVGFLLVRIHIPVMGRLLLGRNAKEFILLSVLFNTNPLAAMQANLGNMFSPGFVPGFFFWPLHCALMLAGSLILLVRSVKIVRKVALLQATGQLEIYRSRRRRKKNLSPSAEQGASGGSIRRVKGSPLVWKELRAPIIQGGKNKGLIGMVATVVGLLITYVVFIRADILHEDFTHVVYTLIFVVMGSVITLVFSAASVTSEKEMRCWPVLLATTLGDWQILLGKVAGIFRRTMAIWLLLVGHVLFFVLVGYIHPVTVFHLSIVVTWIIVFLSGSGIYFSTRFKRTTAAVIANLALALTLWAVIPMLLGLLAAITHDEDTIQAYISANPFVQTVVVVEAGAGKYNAHTALLALDYDWPGSRLTTGPTTVALLVTMLGYGLVGLLFAWRAKCRFRRNIF